MFSASRMKQNVFLQDELAWHDHKSLRLTDEATGYEEVRMHRYVLFYLEEYNHGRISKAEDGLYKDINISVFGLYFVYILQIYVYLKSLVGLVARLQCG